jgi:hypothetical protein
MLAHIRMLACLSGVAGAGFAFQPSTSDDLLSTVIHNIKIADEAKESYSYTQRITTQREGKPPESRTHRIEATSEGIRRSPVSPAHKREVQRARKEDLKHKDRFNRKRREFEKKGVSDIRLNRDDLPLDDFLSHLALYCRPAAVDYIAVRRSPDGMLEITLHSKDLAPITPFDVTLKVDQAVLHPKLVEFRFKKFGIRQAEGTMEWKVIDGYYFPSKLEVQLNVSSKIKGGPFCGHITVDYSDYRKTEGE